MSESHDANDNPPAEVPQKTSNGREEEQNNEDVKKEDKKDEATASVQPPDTADLKNKFVLFCQVW